MDNKLTYDGNYFAAVEFKTDEHREVYSVVVRIRGDGGEVLGEVVLSSRLISFRTDRKPSQFGLQANKEML